jgi:peptidoglycan-N-acetylglucosamine deacetylase
MVGALLVAIASLMVGLGALDGGPATRPSRALGRSPRAAPSADESGTGRSPGRRRAAVRRESLRARLAHLEARTVDRVLRATPYVSVAGRRHREIALTFDDGPGPYTLGIVRVLRRRHAPATFFQVGFTEHWFTDAERAQLRDPQFVLGGHTQMHPRLDRLPAAAQQAQIDEETAVLRAAGGSYPRLFRPPYGTFNATTLALLRQRRMLMVLWTVDSEDYRQPGVPAIVNRVLSGARPGAIVLMHDAGGNRTQTIAALPQIISALRARHYRLVSVPQLLHDDPPPVHQRRPAGTG